jgi:hypothetical protein
MSIHGSIADKAAMINANKGVVVPNVAGGWLNTNPLPNAIFFEYVNVIKASSSKK